MPPDEQIKEVARHEGAWAPTPFVNESGRNLIADLLTPFIGPVDATGHARIRQLLQYSGIMSVDSNHDTADQARAVEDWLNRLERQGHLNPVAITELTELITPIVEQPHDAPLLSGNRDRTLPELHQPIQLLLDLAHNGRTTEHFLRGSTLHRDFSPDDVAAWRNGSAPPAPRVVDYLVALLPDNASDLTLWSNARRSAAAFTSVASFAMSPLPKSDFRSDEAWRLAREGLLTALSFLHDDEPVVAGKQLRAARVTAGWTQYALGKELLLDVENIECGRKDPTDFMQPWMDICELSGAERLIDTSHWQQRRDNGTQQFPDLL